MVSRVCEGDTSYTNVPGEHPAGEPGCMVVAIYAGAAAIGLLVLLGIVVWLSWWPGLLVLGVILGLSAVLWALIRFGAH